MSISSQDYVDFFRHSSPYINAHRGKTFVLMLDGDALADPNFANIVHDIALLNSLGVRLVLVHGARPQIEARLAERGAASQFHQGLRVTDGAALVCVKEAVGSLRTDIEAQLSMGLPNSPMHGARVKVCGGNFVIAKPLGVVDGIDFCHTGEVRRVDGKALRWLLNDGALVLLSNLGFSPTGEVFNLSVEDVAAQVAVAIEADKLICFGQEAGITNQRGERHSELLTRGAERLLHQYLENLDPASALPRSQLSRQLTAITQACRGGVSRGHLISFQQDGALLMELFTRDGAGTMISQESYEQVREASIEDVGGILELIRPLEENGVLVRRSREVLETEIERFTLIERDGAIIGCAALYPFGDGSAELACVAVHPDYRGGDRGDHLLDALQRRALEQGVRRLFVLTTRTAHWFMERGFVEVPREQLPDARQSLYNLQRNSKVFAKAL
ncbi:amino-acid N-acetyltransferase [Motiliproteus sediminis]|uniref:amino-acid N-acetyltransferase n=1 Tax=Motiliproteus sediminis TaxID=1468178 RepID=UPI001AEFBF0B|nr:amino-acid N-acetyltransferase [Motiliproteus sediminis]